MKLLILGASEVADLLTMPKCIQLMRETLSASSLGEATFPPRQVMPLRGKAGALALMPGYLRSKGAVGLKAVSVFPGNLGTLFESHQGAVLLFEHLNGRLLALMDAGSITNIRTAAASASATDVLALPSVKELAILGSGTQALWHLRSMLAVRPGIKSVRVWSRNRANAERFAKRAREESSADVQAAVTAEDAVRGARLVCTVTSSSLPILRGEWVEPGTHINAVGASRPSSRELDTAAVVKGRLFVDNLASALLEADDFRVPKAEGAIDDSHIRGEIGQVFLGKIPGRTGPEDVTIFKSLGLAVEDLASANFLYHLAEERGMGTWVEFGSQREGDPRPGAGS
ncbi:MAG: ornithine cyclodeaminase family protein [archaeon]|nr:MAG: ornithine cyclodeaminase family protein [archaeon]